MTDLTVQDNAPRLTGGRAIVFLASFCLMTVELLAGRVLAPYLGVSLYTWTSIILVVMIGVTLGNYIGGILADRRVSRLSIAYCFMLAGVMTASCLFVSLWIGPRFMLLDWPLWISTSVFSLLVFFPIGFFLSLIQPQIVKFNLKDLHATGATVGTLGAWNALGSIFGTFASGFIFLMYIGIRHLLFGMSVLLVVIGLYVIFQPRFDPLWNKIRSWFRKKPVTSTSRPL